MSGVAKVDTTLGRSLVGTVLQRDDCLSGTHLLVTELAFVLVRFLWSDRWLSILTGFSAKRLKADDYRVEVLPFPQVNGLEGFLWWNSELLGTLEESGDVLHALEGHLAGVDLLDRTGFDRVGEVTQQLNRKHLLVQFKSTSQEQATIYNHVGQPCPEIRIRC